ncbi:pyridoxamine 5'-phosphate oxidase family protein [Methanosarcinaceae archaeon]|nr:pyridoxamine 5'-phosphate oxidase family protein [Methanosarcinaceae archaeon]
MFPEMKRKRQLLSENESVEILKRGTSGVLALSDPDNQNYPYAVPLSYVYSDGRIIFHCALRGYKTDIINKNPKASFCVVDADDVHGEQLTTYFRSVIVFGTVRIVTDESEKIKLLEILGEKYQKDIGKDPEELRQKREEEIRKALGRTAVLVLDAEHMTGKQAKELVSAE